MDALLKLDTCVDVRDSSMGAVVSPNHKGHEPFETFMKEIVNKGACQKGKVYELDNCWDYTYGSAKQANSFYNAMPYYQAGIQRSLHHQSMVADAEGSEPYPWHASR